MEENQNKSELEEFIAKETKKTYKYTWITIGIIFLFVVIFLVGYCKSNNDLKYEIRSSKFSGNVATIVAYVENNTQNYVAYTLDVQIHDRYGEWVGYESGTIRLDPYEKREYMITVNCWASDLSGSKVTLRVF